MLREDVSGISDNEKIIELIKEEINVKEVIFDANISLLAELDSVVTQDLKKEGIARDIIRLIQDARKEKNLSTEDVVDVVVLSQPEIHHMVSEYKEMITKVTSVNNFIFEESGEKDFSIKIL